MPSQITERIVLIAEDEAMIADVVATVVEDAGYTPVIARHGQEALAMAHTQDPALVITDLMMPRLTGAELIEALRAEAAATKTAPIPVILMTAANAGVARTVGADVVLPKPFDLDQLEALLHRFLSHTRAA